MVDGRLGKYPDAVSLFRKAVALQPSSAEMHVNLALALADNGDLPAAPVQTNRAVQLEPRSVFAHRNRARVLQDLQRYREAEREFDVVISLAPDDPFGYFYGAVLARDMGKIPREQELLTMLTQLEPNDALAFTMLGGNLAEQHDQEGAIAALRRAVELSPFWAEAVYRLAQSCTDCQSDY